MNTTLISTIYSIEPVMVCITKFSPTKVILLREENTPKKKTKVEETLQDTIGKFIEIQLLTTSLYDTVKVAQDTANVIDDEKAEGNNIIVNISGGRKPQALGALFGCYARNADVERIVYVTEEDSELIELPILNFGISKTKKQILEELQTEISSVKSLAEKIGISRGMTYNHIRELREMGFIDKDRLSITSAGYLAII